jgi:hypothetical protein
MWRPALESARARQMEPRATMAMPAQSQTPAGLACALVLPLSNVLPRISATPLVFATRPRACAPTLQSRMAWLATMAMPAQSQTPAKLACVSVPPLFNVLPRISATPLAFATKPLGCAPTPQSRMA